MRGQEEKKYTEADMDVLRAQIRELQVTLKYQIQLCDLPEVVEAKYITLQAQKRKDNSLAEKPKVNEAQQQQMERINREAARIAEQSKPAATKPVPNP